MPADEPNGATPLACTLSPNDMAARLTRIQQLTRNHLRSHCLQDSTLRLFYAPDAATELTAIVELERECCAFLAFHLAESQDTVELLVVGPTDRAADALWLFSQFLPATPALPPQRPGACCCAKG